ncbi:MAG: VWA domain-containing protein [Acidobacteriota bacterium]
MVLIRVDGLAVLVQKARGCVTLVLFLALAFGSVSARPIGQERRDPDHSPNSPNSLSYAEPLDTGFKVNVDAAWTQVSASVWDPRHRTAVRELKKEDFELLEDGVPRMADRCLPSQVPVHLMLLLDVSASTTRYLGLQKAVANRFLRGLLPEDRVALATFSSRSTILQPFTSDRSAVKRKLRSIRPEDSTAFYDALLNSIQTLSEIEGRKVIVIFSDGVDNRLQAAGDGSRSNFEQVNREIRRSEAIILAVFLMPAAAARDRVTEQAREQMQLIAGQTGGKMFLPTETAHLLSAFSQLVTELRHTYTLIFRPSGDLADCRHKLWVRVRARPDLVVRSRTAPPSPSPIQSKVNLEWLRRRGLPGR